MKWHSDLLYLFTGLIIPIYKIIDWLGQIFNGYFKKLFVRTEEDAIKYAHNKMKAMNMGHEAKNAHICIDGECWRI